MNFLGETLSFLFSTIITLYTLLLLYFPSLFLRFIFSPVVLSTLILLLYLLRLGAAQNSAPPRYESNSAGSDSIEPVPQPIQDHKWDSRVELRSKFEPDPNRNSNPFHAESFVEWDVRAPLEVIYEEYEGDEAEGNDGVSEGKRESEMKIIQRYASLSLFYPESDSDTSSEGDFPTDGNWDSPENVCFRWEEDDDRDGLIEIALDEKRNSEVDEENLIEIDLSPAR
ncbi:hypothetical protein Salat_0259100 [Sesamum alatum]|uniref:Uncharacterized protein n=1 Tax=Sesamum alatum TaxID=300844 RepID=A0AAE1YZR8_9LAMI|nr:hypothetical protein Salat_0259100 [Sesamum alatum]